MRYYLLCLLVKNIYYVLTHAFSCVLNGFEQFLVPWQGLILDEVFHNLLHVFTGIQVKWICKPFQVKWICKPFHAMNLLQLLYA